MYFNQSSRIIDLTLFTPTLSGGSRWVFETPDFPNMLLKVYKTEDNAPPPISLKSFLRKVFPASKKRKYTIEVNAFLDVMMRSPEASDTLFPQFYGFVNTNFGLAFIYEKLCDSEGYLAPTLYQLMKEDHFVESHRVALNLFFKRLRSEHIVVNDIHAKNVVYSRNRFFLVDGLGDKNLIKIRSVLRYFNNRSQMRKCARIVENNNNLEWDSYTRQYVWTH